MRYGYKPASNSTWLTVSPQSTEATAPTKTPEQLQQEAGVQTWGELLVAYDTQNPKENR